MGFMLFADCPNLISADLRNLNTENMTIMTQMFGNSNKLEYINLSGINTSRVTTMKEMFYGCSSLENIDITGFDTGCVTDFSYMFGNCTKLKKIDLSRLKADSMLSIEGMFFNCASVTELDLNTLNTSAVKSLKALCSGMSSLKNVKLSSLDTSKVENFTEMFCNCRSLVRIDLSSFDASSVKEARNMFDGCERLTSADVSCFKTKAVTEQLDSAPYNSFFKGCINLTDITLCEFIYHIAFYDHLDYLHKEVCNEWMDTATGVVYKYVGYKLWYRNGIHKVSRTHYHYYFDKNGGSGYMWGNNPCKNGYILEKNGSFTLPEECTYTPPEGKVFSGKWIIDSISGWLPEGTKYAAGDTINEVKGNMKISPEWVDGITVSYDANGGSGSMASTGAPKGDFITLPTECGFEPPKGDYFTASFSGKWLVKCAGSNEETEYAAGSMAFLTGNAVIKPLWKITRFSPPQNCRFIEGRYASWDKADYAQWYSFRLYRANQENPVYECRTDSNSLDINKVYKALEAGVCYYYTVQAFKSETEFSPVASGSWQVVPYPTLSASASGVPDTANPGDTLTVNKPDNADASLVHYKWQISTDGKSWTDITGASSASYTVKASDVNKYLRAVITATGYSGQQVSSVCHVIPELTGTLTITGTPQYSEVLTAKISSSQSAALLYTWYRNDEIICSSASDKYTVVKADIGTTLTCKVQAYGNVNGSLTSEGVTIGKADGPVAPTAIGHSVTGDDSKNGWIEISSGEYPLKYYKYIPSSVTNVHTVESGNIYNLSAGTYYVYSAETAVCKPGAKVKVTVGGKDTALAIKPVDPIPFTTLYYNQSTYTDIINVEATGGTGPYTWTIGTPVFSDALLNETLFGKTDDVYTSNVNSEKMQFKVVYPDKGRGSRYGRVTVTVRDSAGAVATTTIIFEGYAGAGISSGPSLSCEPYYKGIGDKKNTYTYGYDTITSDCAMTATLKNTSPDTTVSLKDISLYISDSSYGTNALDFYDIYFDPAYYSSELKPFEEVLIFIIPKTGLDAHTVAGYEKGYPLYLQVKYSKAAWLSVEMNGGYYDCWFKVEPKDINSCTVESIAPQISTGKALTPALRVWDGKRYLTENDYDVIWTNNVETGTAAFTLTGKGNYKGTLCGSFTIIEPVYSDVTLSSVVDYTDSSVQNVNISGYVDNTFTVVKDSVAGSFLNDVSCADGKIGYSVKTTGSNAAKPDDTATVKFTATKNNKSFTITLKITVVCSMPTGVTLNKKTLTLTEGENASLTATVSPLNAADRSLEWSSSDTSVATVIGGNITAFRKGTVTITVKTANGKTDSCTVTVKCAHTHTYTVSAHASTCIEAGNSDYTLCLDCGAVISGTDAPLPLAGHTFVWITDKEANETEDGIKHEECADCHYKRNENTVIPKTCVAVLLGDVDNSGEITVADARLALRAAIGLKNEGLDFSNKANREFIAADVNRDSYVKVDDARLILRGAIHLEDPTKW